MSLDVYLTLPGEQVVRSAQIFVREAGRTRAISREEWDRRFPGAEPVVVEEQGSECVYSANITHNLGQMAEAAGIYTALWRPEEAGIKEARLLIEPLERGLALLRSDPARFRVHDAPNGWGRYEHLVEFVEEYLAACRRWPQALVEASR